MIKNNQNDYLSMKYFTHNSAPFRVILGLLVLLTACKKDDIIDNPTVDNSYRQIKMTPISGVRIAWDYSSLTRLSSTGSSPEVLRISETSLLAVYDNNGSAYMIKSDDNGESWSMPEVLFAKTSHTGKDGENNITYENLMCQPTILQMDNGDIIAACAVHYRYVLTAPDPDVTVQFPASILVKRLIGGSVAEPAKVVYSNLGCQHPELLLLPDGKLHLYFTNSSIPITLQKMSSTDLPVNMKEQQIDMIESTDGGSTWSSEIKEFGPDGVDTRWVGAKTIVFRAQRDNIAPAAEILQEKIIVAYADNKTVTYKPYIVTSTLGSSWPYTINGDAPGRDYARYEILPDKYLITLPDLLSISDEVSLLSYETDANREDKSQIMEVSISDHGAGNFTKVTRPFPFPNEIDAINNSLMRFDANTIMALTSSNFYDTNEFAPLAIKGYLLDDLKITAAEITEYPIFVGGLSETNLRAGIGIDASNLYFNAVVKDNTPVVAEPGTQTGDGVLIYIDAANLSLLDVDKGITKLWVSSEGALSRWDGREGSWVPATVSGITAVATATESGYQLEVTIPKSVLTSFNNAGIRFAAGLSDYSDTTSGCVELLSQCKDLRSSSWLGITF